MPLQIQIAFGGGTPIYWQIVDQICKAITVGRLTAGDQMPSVRALAEQIVVNPNTIAKAYGDLVRDGILETRRGKGVYVAGRRPVFADEERDRRLEQALDVYLHEAMLFGLETEEIEERLRRRLREISERKTEGKDE